MKKSVFYKGILILAFGLCLLSYRGYPQQGKLSRHDRKEAQRAELYLNYQSLDTLLERMAFVLEADYLQDQYGRLTPVPSSLNFIKINVPKAVLQTGSISSSASNGFGGLTAEGELRSWKIYKDKKSMSFTISFWLATNQGNFDVQMLISADNTARATVTSLQRGILIYQGNIVAIYNSGAFKGFKTL